VVGVTLRPEADGPPDTELCLAYESPDAARVGRFRDWRNVGQG